MSLNDHLASIREKYGRLSPQLVVDEARKDEHPLHHRFEWDDSLAGEAFRRVQAAQLIRSVRVTYKEDEQGAYSVRGYVARTPEVDTDADPQTDYAPVAEVLADPIAARVLIQQCKREALAFRRKWQHLEEFAQIVNAALAPEGPALVEDGAA